MRILNYEINASGVVNVTKEAARQEAALNNKQARKAATIREKIYRTALMRSRAGVLEWQAATQQAESIILPNNTELIRVYKSIDVDLHLFALMQTIRIKVIANNFFIYNADGEVNQEATDLFKKKWFRKTVKHIVDSEFYGFSLIQLLDIKDGIFSDAELVPREYVIQQRQGVKTSLTNTSELIPFNAPEYLNWVIPVGEPDNLGLLHKAAPLVIKKKEVISAWSESAEIFGMPLRVGRTNINDPVKRANMEDMLDNIGAAGWAVIHEDDVVEFVETSKTDFYKIYQEFIQTTNSELSKGFLLQTGTTDEKAFSGSAGVHENLLKSLIEAYIVLVEETVNEAIIPACQRLSLIPVGCYFQSDNEQKLSLEEMVKIVSELLKYKDVPNDFILETFGVPTEDKIIEEIANPNAAPSSVMQSVKNMYSNVLKTCEH
jgi:phage gp29-like protein